MAKDNKVKEKKIAKAEKGEDANQIMAISDILKDDRFQHLVADPRFRNIPAVKRKVKIDKRFQGMFTDDKFKLTYTIDKYGRRVNKSSADDLRKFYELRTSSDDDSDVEKEQRAEERAISADVSKDDATIIERDNDDADVDADDDEEDKNISASVRERLFDPSIDFARGEGRVLTDSSSDDESSEDESPEVYIDHVWGELDAQAETTDESTSRLAICNMDWDRIRAVDLMVLFSSFLPPGGSITIIKIYTSEYGKNRLAEEEINGPQELVGLGKMTKELEMRNSAARTVSEDEDNVVSEQDSDVGEGDDYHMEKLRQYQLNRLRYYYAVMECDSVNTADKIYKECDGIEYESSATRVDLRFIPDDTSFDDDIPTDLCTEMPETNTYKPRQFTTTALQQMKVDLTWDETAVERRELGDKLSTGELNGVSDKELRKIIAYSSEEEVEDDNEDDDDDNNKQNSDNIEQQPAQATEKEPKKKEKMIDKYRALLAEINKKEKETKNKTYEMEFTWNVNESKNNDEIETDVKTKAEMTPFEALLKNRNEKNRKRKEERKMKKLQGRHNHKDSDLEFMPDGIDMNDPYFAEEFENGDFVASTNTKKKTKKHKKNGEINEIDENDEKRTKELELLLADDNNNTEDNALIMKGKQHFSLDKIMKAEENTKSKKKRRKQLNRAQAQEVEDDFQVNLNDERFSAIYKSQHYNIDPTDSHFKKTKGMVQLIHEKLKRRHGDGMNGSNEQNNDILDNKRPKKQLENKMLVKSLKRRLQLKQQQK